MTDTNPDIAGVAVRPPVLYLVSIGVGVGLHLLWPVRFFPESASGIAGGGVIVLAFLLFGLARREFSSAGTPIQTSRPTRTVVRSGPYSFSRNPIYLALSLLHLGIAIALNAAALLVTLGITLVIMSFGVIAREERYLARRFGDEYLDYKGAVRRWL